MANTIFSGARGRIPYYATTGTDLTSTGFVYYDPATATFTTNGTSLTWRSSNRDLIVLGHYQSTTPANNSIVMIRSRGSASARTAVTAGDTLGNFRFNAVTNSSGNTITAADIRTVVDTGTVSTGSLNSKIQFFTRRGVTDRLSLEITSETTSTAIGTGGVKAYGGLSVDGPIYARAIFTNGTRVSTFDGNYNNLTNKPDLSLKADQSYVDAADNLLATGLDFKANTADLAAVSTSGSYTDLINKPTIPTNLDSLTDVTITTPSSGQVLKFNGTTWVNGADATSGGAVFTDTIESSKGNLAVPFDFDGNGTVELGDASNGYQKMISSSKFTSSPPVLTSFNWMEGSWATTTGSHAVISCVQGNAANALKKVVESPILETGDTMFIGNVDSGQRAASGFYVHGEQIGMFAYDDNGGQNATTSTISIRSTTNGGGQLELRASGGVRSFNTLTVSGGIIATGSTAYIQTKTYTDTTARDTALPTPVAGMIVLAGTTFFGYTGSAWVALN